MDNDVIAYLRKNPELAEFVRYHPIWYRYLMRDPGRLTELKKKQKNFMEKHFLKSEYLLESITNGKNVRRDG